MIIRCQAHPRAGLVGNPSDGYHGQGNEIQLTDAMRLMLRDVAIYGVTLDGSRYDIGNKLDFLKTNVLYGLQRDDFGPEFREFLVSLVGSTPLPQQFNRIQVYE